MSFSPFKSQIKIFWSLAETKNITKSAQILGLSQPQMTKSLKALENELNFQLFYRSNRGLQITEKGELFLKQIQSLQMNWAEINQNTQELPGLLRIGAHPLVAKNRISKMVDAVTTEYPQVTVQYFEMSSKDVSHALYAGDIDLGLAASPPSLKGLIMSEIEKEDVAIWSAGSRSDTLVVNPQLVLFSRLLKKTKYKKILEIENYEIAQEVAVELKCHALLPEPAISSQRHSFKKIKVLESVGIYFLYSEKNRGHILIQKAKKALS